MVIIFLIFSIFSRFAFLMSSFCVFALSESMSYPYASLIQSRSSSIRRNCISFFVVSQVWSIAATFASHVILFINSVTFWRSSTGKSVFVEAVVIFTPIHCTTQGLSSKYPYFPMFSVMTSIPFSFVISALSTRIFGKTTFNTFHSESFISSLRRAGANCLILSNIIVRASSSPIL